MTKQAITMATDNKHRDFVVAVSEMKTVLPCQLRQLGLSPVAQREQLSPCPSPSPAAVAPVHFASQ